MASLEQLHRAWHHVAENRIKAAQEEGHFRELPGLGRPLEEIVDIENANGWIQRMVRREVPKGRLFASSPDINKDPNDD